MMANDVVYDKMIYGRIRLSFSMYTIFYDDRNARLELPVIQTNHFSLLFITVFRRRL